MASLKQDIPATQIQPETGQELVDCQLVAGQEYQIFGHAAPSYVGSRRLRLLIKVDGYLYRVHAVDLA